MDGFTFDQIFAADPAKTGNVAADASVLIFAPDDAARTPLALRTVDGLPMANPVQTNEHGFGGVFIADIERVAWAGDEFSGFFTSYDGMAAESRLNRAAAQAAAVSSAESSVNAKAAAASAGTAAEYAADSAATEVQAQLSESIDAISAARAAAEAAAALVEAPADEVTAMLVGNEETLTGRALSAAIGQSMTRQVGTELRMSNPAAFKVGGFTDTTWETPDGTGVVVHPSVRYFPHGFNGYRWWAAATPYFGTNNKLENPCIFVSENGTNWVQPPGVTNPLYPAPAEGYNSDTHLMQGPDGKLYLFFREYSYQERIKLMTSEDGIIWSAAVTVIQNSPTVKRLMSPAVWFDGSEWVMLVVEILQASRPLERWTATSAVGPWTYDRTVLTTPSYDTGRALWHLDAMPFGSQIVALLQESAASGAPGRLYLATSDDEGRTFARATPSLSQTHYRSCLLPILTENGLALEVWAGYGAPNWGVKRTLATVPVADPGAKPMEPWQANMLTKMASTSATPPYVLGDYFDRADTTVATGLGSAPSGQVWVKAAGNLVITNKKVYGTGGTTQRSYTETGISDLTVELSVTAFASTVPASDQAFLMFRYVDETNWLRFGYSGNILQLGRYVSGTLTGLFTLTGRTAGLHHLKVTAVGDQITLYEDGVQVGIITESAHKTATKIGISLNTTTSATGPLTVRTA